MKYLLRAEEAACLALAILAIYFQPIILPGWLWPLVFLSPDLSMLGYLLNAKAGAWTYNLIHHKALAAGCMIAGYFLPLPWLLFVGLVLFAHACFDRMLGYGLKYDDGFKHTHLGSIGNK